jgi:NDP-sugar pyrophosphorylase family protein
MNLTFSVEEKPLGTCGPLSLLGRELDADFIVMNGDILTTLDFRALEVFHKEKGARLTVVSTKLAAPFRYGTIVTEGDRLVRLDEKPNLVVDIVAGIYMISPVVLPSIPTNRRFGMDEFIQMLLNQGEKVHVFPLQGYWLDIGSLDDYQRAQSEYPKYLGA